ncbi:MAG: superinfection immunity protein [Candidatus Omnitrophota bacterium]
MREWFVKRVPSEKGGVKVKIACLVAVIAVLYFVPTMIAYGLGKEERRTIFLVNLFLGWTVIGWAGSLIWALWKD